MMVLTVSGLAGMMVYDCCKSNRDRKVEKCVGRSFGNIEGLNFGRVLDLDCCNSFVHGRSFDWELSAVEEMGKMYDLVD